MLDVSPAALFALQDVYNPIFVLTEEHMPLSKLQNVLTLYKQYAQSQADILYNPNCIVIDVNKYNFSQRTYLDELMTQTRSRIKTVVAAPELFFRNFAIPLDPQGEL